MIQNFTVKLFCVVADNLNLTEQRTSYILRSPRLQLRSGSWPLERRRLAVKRILGRQP